MRSSRNANQATTSIFWTIDCDGKWSTEWVEKSRANEASRLDNDMYHHMNNNVYGILYALDLLLYELMHG